MGQARDIESKDCLSTSFSNKLLGISVGDIISGKAQDESVNVAERDLCLPDPTIGDTILDHLTLNAYRINLKGEPRCKPASLITMPTS